MDVVYVMSPAVRVIIMRMRRYNSYDRARCHTELCSKQWNRQGYGEKIESVTSPREPANRVRVSISQTKDKIELTRPRNEPIGWA